MSVSILLALGLEAGVPGAPHCYILVNLRNYIDIEKSVQVLTMAGHFEAL